MKWRPVTEAPEEATSALIAVRRDGRACLLADLYAGDKSGWISEVDDTPLMMSSACEYFWMPESELIAPLEANPAPAGVQLAQQGPL